MKVGMAAAGSGGHVYPALAVAEVLRTRGLAFEDIVFFGGDRMEATAIPEAGYPFVGVDIHGFRRSLSVDNITLIGKVRRARRMIADVVRREGIGVMVVFGGYIAGPAALAASRERIPLVVHEANAVPGAANRIISRRASRVFVAFAPARASLPTGEVIGCPLRRSFIDFDRDARRPTALDRYGISGDPPVLGIVGGSLGAQFLNDVGTTLAAMPGRRFAILHVTGATHRADVEVLVTRIIEEHASLAGAPPVVTVGFERSMADLYAASDLVLCRGGAMTVAEIEATRTPAIIVPLPAGKGYQARNAAELAMRGSALIVEQTTPDDVAATTASLMGDGDRLVAMRDASAAKPVTDAAAVMADAIVGYAYA